MVTWTAFAILAMFLVANVTGCLQSKSLRAKFHSFGLRHCSHFYFPKIDNDFCTNDYHMTKKATNKLVLTIVMVMVMVMLMVRMESRVSAERILTGEHDYGGRITGCVRSHQRSATPHSCSPSSSRATTFQSAAQLATRKLSPQNQLHCWWSQCSWSRRKKIPLPGCRNSWSGLRNNAAGEPSLRFPIHSLTLQRIKGD